MWPSDGSWWSSLSTGGSLQVGWGLTGDVPVPGDYDGDGTTDLAVYRPSDGMWWLLTPSGSRGLQWGLPGDRPDASRELFTLTVLVIALGIAVGSAAVFGGSKAA
jgi:hypothetical protein